MTNPTLTDLRDLGPEQLAAWLSERGYPGYRLDQVLHWLHQRPVTALDQMKNLPARLRTDLAQDFGLYVPREIKRQESTDGAVKLLLELADQERIEAVWMPDAARATLCVSTQVGCRMGCRFCRTGQAGFIRHLRPSEITGQVIAAAALGPVTNIVLMGMGEPLDNLPNVLTALHLFTDPRALAFAERRITVSTIGLVKPLLAFAEQAPAVNLAVSIHSAVAATRRSLMPRGRGQNLDQLKEVLLKYPIGPRQKITFEVTLVAGVNDSEAEARALAGWLSGLRAMVNLIPLNAFPDSELQPPSRETALAYQEVLRRAGMKAFIRKSRGPDILAACGQLRTPS